MNARKTNVEFLEAREDPAEAFQSSEQALHLIAFLVKFAIVVPRFASV
jgi:hypothetical protein